tara:strand:+ start:30 stop:281 length:252 start_codon:yes stop_codon:yes gene_type:complete
VDLFLVLVYQDFLEDREYLKIETVIETVIETETGLGSIIEEIIEEDWEQLDLQLGDHSNHDLTPQEIKLLAVEHSIEVNLEGF